MALFANLHHVGQVVAQLIDDNVSGTPNVQVGPPLDDAASSTEEVRVTLLWVTPQATHRNDRTEFDQIGQRLPPPITLSAFFLVTTYGSTTTQEPTRAQELLGNVIQVFHTFPEIRLTGTPDFPGEGRLTFIEVPTTPELMEHVFVPLQVKHRAWVLFEVGPVQLASLTPASAPPAQIRPDGLRMPGPSPVNQAVLERLIPQSQAETGVVRLDVDLRGQTLAGVLVGGVLVPPADLTELTLGRSYLLTLPPTALSGQTLDVRVQTGPPAAFSNTTRVGVLPAQFPTIDAPPSTAPGDILALTGRGLTGATAILIWPDRGMASPGQVTTLAVTNVSASGVDSTTAPGLPAGRYRCAVRLPSGAFTPFVLLELKP